MSEQPSLDGRVALVTGASGGIGSAIARRLGAAGALVAAGYGRHADGAWELVDELTSSGARAFAVGADLQAPEAADELVDAVEAELGPIDIVVANAGLARVQELEQVSARDFDEVVAVNLRAPFLLARRTVPGMCERGFGRVLLVSSIAALTGGIVGPHYAASKAGLHGLAHFLAARGAPHGVTVNVIAPALITETGMLPGDPEQLRARVPVGRLGTPDEVADLALAVLRNAYLTNQVISLDGGIHPR